MVVALYKPGENVGLHVGHKNTTNNSKDRPGVGRYNEIDNGTIATTTIREMGGHDERQHEVAPCKGRGKTSIFFYADKARD